MGGCYRFPAIDITITGVFTNKMCTDAIRGAGRPEATYWIELTMDQLADELGMDRLELRRKNFIQKEEFPFETALGIVHDSGDYEGTLDKLLSHFDVDAFRAEQEELRARASIAGSASRPMSRSAASPPRGRWARRAWASRRRSTSRPTSGLRPPARRSSTGTSPHGQGIDTSFAQIAGDILGIDPENVTILHGDTDQGAWGWDTYGSRSLAVGGEALARAARKVQDKAKRICAAMLEAAPEDIELSDGKYQVRGSPDKAMTMAEISGRRTFRPRSCRPTSSRGSRRALYDPENFVFPFGAHACVVEVDAETGKVEVVRYVAVDDCGPAINPMLVDGQVHGGIVHAIGQALYEQVVYDEEGQLVTGTFVDYALPTAAELPSFETDRTETPSPGQLARREGGRRGRHDRGHAGGGVRRARRPGAVRRQELDMPFTPMRVWEAIQAASGNEVGMITAPSTTRRPRAVEEAVRCCTTTARTPSCSPAATRCCP